MARQRKEAIRIRWILNSSVGRKVVGAISADESSLNPFRAYIISLIAYDKNINKIVTEYIPQLVSIDCKDYIQNYLESVAPRFHKTANRLGVSPTGALTKAARATYRESSPGSIIIHTPDCPILNTARGPVDIYPKTKKYLTIPIHNLSAYRKASELPFKLFKRGNALATNDIKTSDGKPVNLYALCKHVRLSANPSIYPSIYKLSTFVAKYFNIAKKALSKMISNECTLALAAKKELINIGQWNTNSQNAIKQILRDANTESTEEMITELKNQSDL